MPRLADLGDCPLCFGKLLPLSVCQSCNSTMVRDRMEAVEPELACEDCGATNSTHFVCSACNARFPYREIVRQQGPTCPVCKSAVSPGAPLCPKCGAVLPSATGVRPRRRLVGEYGEADVREVSRIPGVTRETAEALCRGGFRAPWRIARAPLSTLARVRGIGPRTAARIKDGIAGLQIASRLRSKEEVLSEESACPLCGTVTSLFSTRCHDCGAAFDAEELDEELAREVEREEDKGLLAYYDIRLLEAPEDSSLLYARSMLLVSMNRPADALSSLDKVLEAKPGDRRALQAKARVLASVRGVGSAAQVLRGFVGVAPSSAAAEAAPTAEVKAAAEALQALGDLEEPACPTCGEPHVQGAKECPACGHRFAPEVTPAAPAPAEAPPSSQDVERIRLLDELERAVAGEVRAPPPPLKPVVPESVVDGKREMYAFLADIAGVSRRAAEAASAFFQDLAQVGLADVADLQEIPGIAPAEARLIRDAVGRRLAREEAPPRPEGPSPEALPSEAPVRAARPLPAVPEAPSPPPAEGPAGPPVPPIAPAEARTARPSRAAVADRRGLVNGKGLVNGRGRVNGLINGTGFVNGASLAQPILHRQRLMPRYVAIGSALMMVFAIAVALIQPTPVESTTVVDGSFGEWSGVSYAADAVGTTSPNLDIRSVRVAESGSFLYLGVTVRGAAFGDPSGYDSLYAFLDADGDRGTGYDLGGFGADYMARFSGSGGAVEESRLMRFGEPSSANWHGWAGVPVAVEAAANGSNVEAGVPLSALDGYEATRAGVLFSFEDNAGRSSETRVPVGPGLGILRVRQSALNSTLAPEMQDFLMIEFEALGANASVLVTNVSIDTNAGTFIGVDVPFTVNASAVEAKYFQVDPTGLAAGTVVRAAVASVTADRPYAVLGSPARAYVGAAPAGKAIDGAFGDWAAPLNDSNPVSRRDGLNVLAFDGSAAGNDVYAYARLDGIALEGVRVPTRIAKPTGGGGPGGTPQPTPPPPPLRGLDYVRFFLDTNESEPAGSDVYGLRADSYMEVRGRLGRVVDASLYRWNGSAWPRQGAANAAANGNEVEVGAAIPGATFNRTRLVAVTGDWSGVVDVTQPELTRGTRGGPTLAPLDGTNPQTATAKMLSAAPSIDHNCATGGSGEYAGADVKGVTNLSFHVGYLASRLYVCIDVTDSTPNGASDWGLLVIDRAHNGGSNPQVDDRRFTVTSADVFSAERGTGSGWTACDSSYCASDNTASGGSNNSGALRTYEFDISFWDVWENNDTVSDTAGFAVVGREGDTGTDYEWAEAEVDQGSPGTWEHLEIPEFRDALPVAAITLGLVGWLGSRSRRRRLREAPPVC